MSSTIKNNPHRAAGLVPFPSLTGCLDSHGSGQSGPPSSLRYRIEKELVGVPSHVQKDALKHLLHLLGEENASHQKKNYELDRNYCIDCDDWDVCENSNDSD